MDCRLLCPWDSPGKNIGVGSHFLLQGIVPIQGPNPHLPGSPALQADSLLLSHQGSNIQRERQRERIRGRRNMLEGQRWKDNLLTVTFLNCFFIIYHFFNRSKKNFEEFLGGLVVRIPGFYCHDQVQFLVGELGSCKPGNMTKKSIYIFWCCNSLSSTISQWNNLKYK